MTTTPKPPAASTALLALRERFRETAGSTVATFAALATQLAEAPGTPEVLQALRRELHRVRGTAGSYGFLEASRLAGRLEERVARWLSEPALDVRQRAAAVEQFAAALHGALDAGAEPASASAPGGGSGRS